MKRVYNNVALSTVVGVMSGFTKVVIEDRTESERWNDKSPETRKWSGLVKDLYKASDEIKYKWMNTKVREIRHCDDHILIVISTQYEEY